MDSAGGTGLRVDPPLLKIDGPSVAIDERYVGWFEEPLGLRRVFLVARLGVVLGRGGMLHALSRRRCCIRQQQDGSQRQRGDARKLGVHDYLPPPFAADVAPKMSLIRTGTTKPKSIRLLGGFNTVCVSRLAARSRRCSPRETDPCPGFRPGR